MGAECPPRCPALGLFAFLIRIAVKAGERREEKRREKQRRMVRGLQ
jgi:hypothetical protein